MDPQQRWFLETSYRALENAGIPLEKVAGTNTAVYASSTSEDYIMMTAKDPDHAAQMVSTATSPSIQANRLSWYFDLRGPSIHVNTACSSSMITVDLACQSLRSGQSSMALLASGNSLLSPEWSLYMSNMNFLSPDSRCYSFDHRANGYARGEGVVVFVLKRLSDAIRDGDPIRGVIRGTGTNQDGHTPTMPQPNQSAQEALIRQVYKSCNLGFEATRYVEAHGTGTQIGDVTEATALGRVFRSSRSSKEPLYIGSIKASIGHLEGGSGLASILKTIMILEKGIIPPNALFEKLNPKIKASFYHLEVPTACIPWPAQGVRRISVDSFGFGGANSHIILDDALHTIEALAIAGNHRTLAAPSLSNGVNGATHVNGTTNGVNGVSHKASNTNGVNGVDHTTSDTNGVSGVHETNGLNGVDHAVSKTNGVNATSLQVNGTNGANGVDLAVSKTNGLNVTNHAINKPSTSTSKYRLLTWSARDEAALKRTLHLYDEYLKVPTRSDASFLGDLAYTLAARRTLMAWRSFSIVNEQSATEALDLPTAKCERAARDTGIAFVFTGQGAQYANMGMELLCYPTFKATLVEIDGIFRKLGAEWSIFDKLGDKENIDKPEFSQPLCTALQIALVELLETFNIFPDVVVGHSSGEVAAAYTVGALSLRSACEAAFHRGRLAGRIAAMSKLKPGAMMSVNLAESEAESYLVRASLLGHVSVACINSPGNVTLSGDEKAIDQLQVDLEKDGIFARKIKTGVAYHSPAMQQVAEEYLSSMGRLEPRELNSRNPIMVSSVTSQKAATANLLDPQYWVDNLVSPVRFNDALQYIVHTAPKVDSLKPITNYIEIGSHGALQRPIRDSLAHAGNSTARHGSTLSRQIPPSKAILQLVGQLFTSGHRVSVTAANQQDGPSPNVKPVVDTPEYSFDKTLTYWHESRISRDWRLREEPTRSLLGLRTSDWNPLQPRWRKMLRVEEVPWIADHVVGNTIVFPAVGSIVIAIEAVRQIARGDRVIRGYHVKEATFMSPIVIPAGEAAEVMTHLRPLQEPYEKSSTRFEIEIFSYAEKYWRACNKCTIHVEFEQEAHLEVDHGQELKLVTESMARKYEDTRSTADVRITTPDFYHWLEENAFRYGPTFSLAEEVSWDGNHLAVARVNVGRPVDTFEEGVVHPGVLDSCLQLCPIPPSHGMTTNVPTSVPHKIKDAWIAETGWRNPTTERVDVLTEAKLKTAGAGLDCEVAVLSETGVLLCHIKRLEMLPIMGREAGVDDGVRKMMHHIDWKPQVSLRTLQESRTLDGAATITAEDEDAVANDRTLLEETLRSVAQHNIDGLRYTEWERMPAHMKRYISWTDRRLREKPSAKVTELSDLDSKLQDISMRRPSWKVFTEVAQILPLVARGDAHELDLALSSDLYQDYLDDTVTAVCNQDFEAYLGLLAHQKPTQKILEIGGRRGALTSYVLSALQATEARTGGMAFSEYTFSDTSTASLDAARKRFADHQNRMDFVSLDVNQDLTTQGLQPASFDVIFAADILQGATDISVILQDLGRVLAPGGQLLLHEMTVPERFEIGFGFGVSLEWWSGHQDNSSSDKTLTTAQWDTVLKDNGFSGTELVFKDYHNDAAHCSSLMITRRVPAQPSHLNEQTKVFIVIDGDDDFQKLLAESVLTLNSTAWNFEVRTLSDIGDEKLEPDSFVVCLADVYRPYLHPMTHQTLNVIRSWVQQSKNLFYVTAYDTESTEFSSSSSYAGIKDGLLRTLRSEFALNRIVSLTLGESTRDAKVCAEYVFGVFESAFIQGLSTDVEFMVREGEILSGRLVDDIDTNQALSSSVVQQATPEPWLPGPPLTLAIQTRGQLETLHFEEDLEYYEELGPLDVEIEAKVWGVGFRDVFLALGRLEENDFGADCAGIVTRVGAEVQSFKAGDRVCAQTFNSMKTFPRSREWSTAKIADSVSFEDACAVVIPGMTAIQSFMEIARLEKGEKVLIHSASGGTGQVALQIAQMVGAEVFATVGYDSKKQLLIDQYDIPADHIFYSRDTSFAQGIMRVTDGYGVDVVLNSLVGESLRASWDCMAPYGRMIEIGKAEINANAGLPMASFAKNCMFAGVDIHHIVHDMRKNGLTRKLLQQTMDLAGEGSVRAPTPLHVYDVDSVEDAFRYLASGRNSGRILIRVDPATKVQKPLINRRTWRFDENATYLVAGGLGGIGRSILRWMVTRGAKHLLVPSRSGAVSAAASGVVRELSEQNVVVSTPQCDVSSKDALSQMLVESGKTLPPIRGCIVATMALNDCLFDNMTLTQWEQTSCSKVESSWNLHTLLPELDHFIMLSSVSGVVGNPGQSNYAAGCTFQDALARHRSQGGQKAISIDLGVMRSVGVVAESDRLQQHLQSNKGFIQIEEAEFLSLLDICCDPSYCPDGDKCQMVMGLETPAGLIARSLEPPEVLQRPLFASFSQLPGKSGSSSNAKAGGPDAARLFRQAESQAERAQVVVEALSKRLARTLTMKFEDVDTHQALHAYGVDSLIAVELRTWLGKEFAADVPVFEIVSGKTIEAVGELVAKTSSLKPSG